MIAQLYKTVAELFLRLAGLPKTAQCNIQVDQKVSVHLMITVQKTRKNILKFQYHDNLVRIMDSRRR
jgi:hypothetical protein